MPFRGRAASRSVVAAAVATLAMSLAPLASPAAVRAVPSGPVARWTFDETSGTTAHDAASTHDGTLLGNPTWSPTGGHDGSGALVFDGNGDGVQVPTAAALQPTSATVLMWMKGSRTDNPQFDTLIQKGANGCEAGSYGLQAIGPYQQFVAGGLYARGDLAPADGVYWLWGSPEAALWNGNWHLVGWTFDAGSDTSRVYVDGIASETPLASILYGLPASDLFIGREPTDCPDSRDFQGTLDDVRIYDRALTADEIQAMVPAVATSATFAIESNPIHWSQWTWATVTVTPAPVESAEVRVYDVSNGGHVLKTISGTSPVTGVATLQLISGDLAAFDVGSYDLVAEVQPIGPFDGSTSNQQTLVVDKFENTVSIESNPQSVTPGGTATLTGTVSNYTDGTATFYEDHGGGDVESIGTAPLVFSNGPYKATLQTAALGLGQHTFLMRISETAHFAGAESEPVVVNVANVASVTSTSYESTLQTHHPVRLTSGVAAASYLPDAPIPTGTITFRDGATILGTVDYAVSELTVASMTVGSHTITAEYSGDGFYLGSTSDPMVLEITADTVDATGVGVQYTTFYPVTDGYRDTDAIKGNRLEPLSVSIRIYNASNGLVKSVTLARAAGTYSYAWNGRNSGGAVLAAGKYRIVQTLTDAFGTKKAWTSYATLSTKKLVTHSTYVTRYGYPPTATGQGGTGKGYYSSTGKYVKLVAGSDGYVLAGWQFTLPSATVYKSLKFQVYARGPRSVPPNMIAGQNFSWCALSSAWYDSCFDHWTSVGGSTTTAAWYSTSLSPTYNRTGRTVRGLIDVEYGTVYVYKVRVYVSYATLQ